MDRDLMISLIIFAVLLEAALVVWVVLHRQGKLRGNPLITLFKKEWLILFYAFFKWNKPKYRANEFTYHKQSAYFWFFLALVHEQLLEMFIFHYYLKILYPETVWIMTGLHIYSVFYLMGDYNVLRHRPVTVKNGNVHMRIGLRRELSFGVHQVASFEPTGIQYNKQGGIIHPSNVFHATAFPRVLTRVFGAGDDPSYAVKFKTPLVATGYFGRKFEVSEAWLYLDEPERFIETVQREQVLPVQHESAVKKTPIVNWKLYWILMLINIAGALAIIPYAMEREGLHTQLGLSPVAFGAFYLFQVVIETGVLVFLALLILKKLALYDPAFKKLTEVPVICKGWWLNAAKTIGGGLVVGSLILAVSLVISKPLGIDNSTIQEPVWWLSILGAGGAAINEESIFRMFLVSLIMILLVKIGKRKVSRWKSSFAIVFAALVFGIMHYGVAMDHFELTPGLFFGMVLINGIGGLFFGFLFLTLGIEFAMIAHFSANIAIHVVAPFFI
ncbi:hypothetical protein KP77_08420 [Jeotgalibacillus alimentarius]|uniref:CAAX prenyl protease 2/Lysostaphin resistance protein A-like domain-containing protein n=1 Tax=Jeotgalibacillus alimentarius TaxID=135826 RepID=A0A0C2RM25_9BACL|nr:CPBP family glutamic-type intramembrane protease [Jeotgalibacillus alimentarius]KIL51330.1 hypothetical protein KP77_08420 [Jeotgalibacillus alimentarius]